MRFLGFIFMFIIAQTAMAETITRTLLFPYLTWEDGVMVTSSDDNSYFFRDVRDFSVTGSVAGVDCTRANACKIQIMRNGPALLATISLDENRDGRPESTLENIEIGFVNADSQVYFAAPLKAEFIIKQYNVVQEFLGYKDDDYVRVTLDLTNLPID